MKSKFKKIIFFFLLPIIGFSQFKLDYKEINSKYKNLDDEHTFIITKTINEFESGLFCFSRKDSLLTNVRFKNLKTYKEEDFLKITKEYINNFSASKTKHWENWILLYDEKNKIIIIKIYEDTSKTKLTEIEFISDEKTVCSYLKIFDVKFIH